MNARLAIVLTLAALAPVGCRCVPRGCPPPARASSSARLLARIETGDAEARYYATLALGRHDTAEVRDRLRVLLESEEPLTRNAAARALVELGEEDAAAALIANLDRRLRTWAVTDAIHHLRALFGTDRGYDPNRGYRHQTEMQEAWWAWWTAQGGVRPGNDGFTPDEEAASRFETLRPRVDAYANAEPGSEETAWEATARLWKAMGELAPSREPEHVALVARAFGLMAQRFPEKANLWNNHALASLNDGQYEDAEASYQKALALAPDDAFLHNDYGILLEGLGRLEEAATQYAEAIRLDPEDAVWCGNLADVLATLGPRTEAIEAYREAERLNPEVWYYHRLPIRRLGDR